MAAAADPTLFAFADLLIELLPQTAAEPFSETPPPPFPEHASSEQAGRRPEDRRPESQHEPPETALIALAVAPACPVPAPLPEAEAPAPNDVAAPPAENAAPPAAPPQPSAPTDEPRPAPSAAPEGERAAAGRRFDAELSPPAPAPARPAPPLKELPAALPEGVEIETQPAPIRERAPLAFALRLTPPAEPSQEAPSARSPAGAPPSQKPAAASSPAGVPASHQPAARSFPAEPCPPAPAAAEPRPAPPSRAPAGPETAAPPGQAPPAPPDRPAGLSQDPPVSPASERRSAAVSAPEPQSASNDARRAAPAPAPAAEPATPERPQPEAAEKSAVAQQPGPPQAPPGPRARQAGDPGPLRSEQPAEAAAGNLERRPAAPPPREISLRLSSRPRPEVSAETVALRVVERAGRIHVSVRSADPALADSLRSELPALVKGLERGGFRSEIVEPGAPAPPARAWAAERTAGDRPQQGEQPSGWHGQPDAQRERRQAGPFAFWQDALEESVRPTPKSLGEIRHDDAR